MICAGASELTCAVREVFSVVVQVTVTEVTSEAVVEMREEAGFCSTRVSMVVIFVTTSAQFVAFALNERPVLTLPVQERVQHQPHWDTTKPFPGP